MNNGDVRTKIHPIYLGYSISVERVYDEYWVTVFLNTPNSDYVVASNEYTQEWWDEQLDPLNTIFDYWIKYISDGNLW